MFFFDFVTRQVMDELMEWLFSYLVLAVTAVFGLLSGMGLELFSTSYVQALVEFFRKMGFILFLVGIIMAVFECALEYQSGRGSIRDTFLNIIKGYLATRLFTSVPVALYYLAVRWQTLLGIELTMFGGESLSITDLGRRLIEGRFMDNDGNTLVYTFLVVVVVYAIIKVFFSNIKRGGILLTQIAVGSLYMISIPRGYQDGFKQWAKQVIGLCLTAFLQSTFLTIGLLIAMNSLMVGIGVMLASTEIPRICGQYGLDTSAKTNLMGGANAIATAVNVGKTIIKIAA